MNNFLKKYFAVRSSVDYNFSNLRDVIVELERCGRRNGFNNPAVQLTISCVNQEEEYDICVNVCYKLDEDKYEFIKKNVHVFSFSNLPDEVARLLKKDKSTTVTFNQDDVREIIENKDLQIFASPKPLASMIEHALSRSQHTLEENLQINIRDFVLYYRVIINLRDASGHDEYITEFLTSSITGIPATEMEKLNQKHEVDLVLHN